MVFYAAFNSISVISRRQLTLFMISWVSPVLGRALKCLVLGHSHEKTQRIQCGSNPGPLDYESNTLPLGHAGPWLLCKCSNCPRLLGICTLPEIRMKFIIHVNPSPNMPILGSSSSNEDLIISLRKKHCGTRINCSLRAISSFPTMFSKAACS